MHREQLVDLSPRKGVFVGDLKYGRCNITTSERGHDFAGEENAPIAPLVLVANRDPEVWRRDSRLKEARRKTRTSQYLDNQLLNSYIENVDQMRANIHLTIGKQRI